VTPARALALALLVSCGGASVAGRGAHRRSLEPVLLERVEGGWLDLSELRGRIVVLFFFTTYSGPAQAIEPFVAQVARRHAQHSDVAVVAVALDEAGSRPIVQEWRDFVDAPFPVVLADEDVHAGRSPLGPIPAIPSFAFLDADGALVGWDVRLLNEEQLNEVIDRIEESTR